MYTHLDSGMPRRLAAATDVIISAADWLTFITNNDMAKLALLADEESVGDEIHTSVEVLGVGKPHISVTGSGNRYLFWGTVGRKPGIISILVCYLFLMLGLT